LERAQCAQVVRTGGVADFEATELPEMIAAAGLFRVLLVYESCRFARNELDADM
jgi:hypothetical protein